MTSPITLITGASGGIGEDLAGHFAKDGKDLVLVARSAEKLEAIAESLRKKHKVSVHVFPLDLAARDAAARVTAALAEKGLHAEVLVNNAGYGAKGAFAELEADYQLGMIDLNIYALTALTRALVPGMIERGEGGVMNIASTAAFLPGPRMAVYYASKAYVLSFSRALQYELKDKGVSVTAVCPGPTATGFQDAARLTGARLVTLSPLMSSKRVARLAYKAFKRKQPVVVTGLMNRIQAASMAFTPARIKLGLVNFLQA
ncbi:short-chain dehydrogenase [Tepidicaulis marinus]|uniref:Short-chain dehydrogenase n=1 Tax=Tepidicaulis marinus TaxID=1333998 RepID=A0A081B682_9HYPH|nr:SDR family oxidoreductase [Tepidicaulis marinus]GAK43550.1 short-chain dehydrogenase [Tepidicaulis marinus]